MIKRTEKVEVAVEEVLASAAVSAPGVAAVVIETESRVDGHLHDTSIEVREEDAPAMAAALLSTEASGTAAPADADLPIAVQCMAAGIVHAASDGRVRLHLQFESGQVLPIEMPRAAAAALARTLAKYTASG